MARICPTKKPLMFISLSHLGGRMWLTVQSRWWSLRSTFTVHQKNRCVTSAGWPIITWWGRKKFTRGRRSRRISTFGLDPNGGPDSHVLEGCVSVPEWSSSPCNPTVLLITEVARKKISQCRKDVRNGKLGRDV